jgi:PTS system glucose-specific IIA component
VRGTSTRRILIHLGIDTVELAGAGFDVHVAVGEPVAIGAPFFDWV